MSCSYLWALLSCWHKKCSLLPRLLRSKWWAPISFSARAFRPFFSSRLIKRNSLLTTRHRCPRMVVVGSMQAVQSQRSGEPQRGATLTLEPHRSLNSSIGFGLKFTELVSPTRQTLGAHVFPTQSVHSLQNTWSAVRSAAPVALNPDFSFFIPTLARPPFGKFQPQLDAAVKHHRFAISPGGKTTESSGEQIAPDPPCP